MIALAPISLEYLRAPANSFWQWADKGAVLEWKTGLTICYRDDLLGLLRQLHCESMPGLDAVLLLLAATSGTIGDPEQKLLQLTTIDELSGTEKDNTGDFIDTISFLNIIAALPDQLRKGNHRVHLLHEILGNAGDAITCRDLNNAILLLNNGQFDDYVFNQPRGPLTDAEPATLLRFFAAAFKKYPTTQDLIVKLRTGVDKLPPGTAAEMPMPAGNILSELAEDPKTAGLAALANTLIAAIHIPMQSRGSSDQPFGGISDITNRGNYDKLLLTELGYDDDTLMARLVNNEALYFRREQPPQQPKPARVILIDSTIKMWGTSRLFALSAGIAATQQQKHFSQLAAYILGGNAFTPVNLTVKPGVIQALEKLDHALHCGYALESVIAFSSAAKQEIIFITDNKLLHNGAFNVSMAAVKHKLSFVIAVSATGEIILYEYINGIRKQIGFAKVDVDDLLSPRKPLPAKPLKVDKNLPLFLSQKPAPLYFVPVRIKQQVETTFKIPGGGLVAVISSQRVLYVKDANSGALELLSFIERGSYDFSLSSDGLINIVVVNPERNMLKLYRVNPDTTEFQSINIYEQAWFPVKVIFKNDDELVIQDQKDVLIYNLIEERIISMVSAKLNEEVSNLPRRTNIELQRSISYDKFYIKPRGFFYRVNNIYLSHDGNLVVGDHTLIIEQTRLVFKNNEYSNTVKTYKKTARFLAGPTNLVNNKHISFFQWGWEDGSIATIDSRGLIHLKSADTTLPEITLTLVIGSAAACWASDGTYAGSGYYLVEKAARKTDIGIFYKKYIQQYINRIS